MSDLLKFPKRGSGPPQPPSDPPTEISIVQHVKRSFLVADTQRRKLKPSLEFATSGSAMRAVLVAPSRPSRALVAKAQEWRVAIPPREELLAAATMFEAALVDQARPIEIGATAAWLVDAYHNRRADVGVTFTDTLELILEDADEVFSAAVLAATVRKLIEDSAFLPTGSEFLAGALKMRNTFRSAAIRARHLIELRDSALDVLWNANLLTRVEYGLPEEEDDSCPF